MIYHILEWKTIWLFKLYFLCDQVLILLYSYIFPNGFIGLTSAPYWYLTVKFQSRIRWIHEIWMNTLNVIAWVVGSWKANDCCGSVLRVKSTPTLFSVKTQWVKAIWALWKDNYSTTHYEGHDKVGLVLSAKLRVPNCKDNLFRSTPKWPAGWRIARLGKVR